MAEAAANLAVKSEPRAHAGYRVVVEPSDRRIRVVYRGETVADSTRALVMHETRLPSAFYFPRDDVRMDLMARTDRRTHCPFKGNASYWTLRVGEHQAENAVWSYEDPFDESSSVRDYIGFIWDAVDAWYADDEEILEQPRHRGAVKDNPFIGWLVNEAWKSKSSPDLVKRFAEGLVAAGFPLWRLRVVIRTLNPQLFAVIHTWQKDVDEIGEFQATHEELERQRFVSSPFAAIIRGEGGVRRRLEGPNVRLDFPILEDLVAEGATDYVAMPMRFSDGQINIVTLVSDRSGGFSTDDLGQLYEILPTLSRLLEAHAQRVSSLTLLRTYLGGSAGERVMNGKVKRGDGEDLHAVIWFSDLRGSTALADSIGREAYLDTLNQYFDGVAGAVIEHGGEVLKFIGDAVLAVFAIDDPVDPMPEACIRALTAVADARQRIAAVNGERVERGEPALAFGVGLHRGNLTYGNIGTEGRLDFTVIGPAVNEAARIEDLCKTLETSVLMSEALAASVPGETGLVSLGRHTLRGVRTPQEIFALPS
jgi:adenylate cyclase